MIIGKGLFLSKIKIVAIFLLLSTVFLFFWTQPNISQAGTIKIWDRNSVLLYESAGNVGKKNPVTYNKFSQHLIDAIISSEDETFWSNPGVDFRAMLRSLWEDIKARRVVSGASTITQQLVRSSIISPQQINSQRIIRKTREIFMALRLTATYSKKDILTMYLNQMYFGNLSYGVQAAASTYFDKDVSQLSLAESAFLAGLISSPNERNPFTNFKGAKGKQLQVLALMAKNGFISKDQLADAKQEKLALTDKKVDIKAPHFVHYVLDELDSLSIKSNQGLNIYTTFDYPTFLLSEQISKLWVDRLKDEHNLSNAALVLINNDTGEILDMMGGIDYFDASHSGQVNMTVAPRQPGSALKPVTYATAFMKGYTPATLIYDIKKVYKTRTGEGFTPNNYDGRYHGLVLAREALASSLNLPAVEMLNRVGINNFLKTARDLGISSLTQENRYDLSLTLGGGEVKLLDLTNVFASFARGGQYKPNFAIQKITDDSGKTLFKHQSTSGIQVLGKNGNQIAYLITNILSDPKARILGFGEKNPLVLSRPAAVKTGTTTDWHDNWTVGYTPSYTVGVWVGNNDNQAMKNITGVVGAAPIWNQFFEEYLKGKPQEQFDRPVGIKEVEICKLSGELPDTLCPEKTTEIFINGTQPKTITKLFKKVQIDKKNGLLANNSCSKQFVEDKIFIDYPPEVYTWAIKNEQEVIPTRFSPFCSGQMQTITKSFLEITYPKEKTVFESAPLIVKNQSIVFEVNVSSNINKVLWYMDGLLIKETTNFPFNAVWNPLIGMHTIRAVGQISNGNKINSENINISVVEYKNNY